MDNYVVLKLWEDIVVRCWNSSIDFGENKKKPLTYNTSELSQVVYAFLREITLLRLWYILIDIHNDLNVCDAICFWYIESWLVWSNEDRNKGEISMHVNIYKLN